MITNNKGKFTRNIHGIETELGSKNGLFQVFNEQKEGTIEAAKKQAEGQVKSAEIQIPKSLADNLKKAEELQKYIEHLRVEGTERAKGFIPGYLKTQELNLKTAEKELAALQTSIQAGGGIYSSSVSAQAQIESAKQQAEAAKLQKEGQVESAKKQAEASKYQAEAAKFGKEGQIESARLSAEGQKYSATIQADATKYVAEKSLEGQIKSATAQIDATKIQADAIVKAAKIASLSEDNKTLDGNETKAISIFLKYAIKDPANFDPKTFADNLNKAREEGSAKEYNIGLLQNLMDKSDAKEFEKALKGDEKLKKADGKIDIETMIAFSSMVNENLEAIKGASIVYGAGTVVGKVASGDIKTQDLNLLLEVIAEQSRNGGLNLGNLFTK